MTDSQGMPWPAALNSQFAALHVSRETSERLAAYVTLLRKWNPAINLVSARSLGDVWQRHILDSVQLIPMLPAGTKTVVDLGSGAGLPGLAIACFGVAQVHLIESDRRKCIFLSQAIQALDLDARVHNARIADVAPISADVVTARALAPVAELLDHADSFMAKKTQCLFLKSLDVASELTQATKGWTFKSEQTPSRSDSRGVILRIWNVERR